MIISGYQVFITVWPMLKKLTQYQLTLQTPVIVNVHFMTFFHVKVMTLFQRGVNDYFQPLHNWIIHNLFFTLRETMFFRH